ncbi:MAG TPA: MarC family protein [Gaiellaceae bacterium]|nr:MarC family protein [Gaiellaceae bacterium]
MNWRAFGETFVTLFVITDPPGNAPIFVAITRSLTPRERQQAAVRAVAAAGLLIVGFAIFGELVLRYLHVSIRRAACRQRHPLAHLGRAHAGAAV